MQSVLPIYRVSPEQTRHTVWLKSPRQLLKGKQWGSWAGKQEGEPQELAQDRAAGTTWQLDISGEPTFRKNLLAKTKQSQTNSLERENLMCLRVKTSTWPRKCAGRQVTGRSYERKSKDALKCLLEQKDPGQEEKLLQHTQERKDIAPRTVCGRVRIRSWVCSVHPRGTKGCLRVWMHCGMHLEKQSRVNPVSKPCGEID